MTTTPAPLDLDSIRAEYDQLRPESGELADNIPPLLAALTAAREELAKTRAELDELRGVIREGVSAAEWQQAEVTTWKRKAAKLREQLGKAKARISAAATVQVWTNEDGERFVFADDLMDALDPNPEASPATTAEPADEPKATCHLPVQNGQPCGLLTCRKHGCRVAPDAAPAAS